MVFTWSSTKKDSEIIRTNQNSLERSILNIRKKDGIRICKIKNRLKENLDWSQVAKRKLWD